MENRVGWIAYATFILECRDIWANLEGQQGWPTMGLFDQRTEEPFRKEKNLFKQSQVSTSQV